MRAQAVRFRGQKLIYFNQRPLFDREVKGLAKREREIKIKMRSGDLKTRKERARDTQR